MSEQIQNESVPMMSVPQSQNEQRSKEENMIWDLEVWKRAEQTKFKAYLKQLEFEYISKKLEEFRKTEELREKEFKSKINEVNVIQNKLRKKASELETRENKISLCEEELKLKINEVSRQLTNKDDEIIYLKNRFKEEKLSLEKQKNVLNKNLAEKEKLLAELESQFKQYKKEIEDSPVSLLKNELNKKQIQYEELTKEKNRLMGELEKAHQVNDKLKNDMIKMKKAFDDEKDSWFRQKVEEIDKLKFEIYNQKAAENEMNELKELREKVKQLTGEKDNTIDAAAATNQGVNGNTVQGMGMTGTSKREYKILTISRKNNKFDEGDAKNQIDRLTKERNMLLNGGLYDETDPLIVQLDSKIRKLLQATGNY